MKSEFERYVVQAVINFYNYDYSMLGEYLDDNVIWYGPKAGQCIIGRENLMKEFGNGKPKTKFFIENINTRLISYSYNSYFILVSYRLYTPGTNGSVKEYMQRVIASGNKCHDQNGEIFWRCPFIHVANLLPDNKHKELTLSREENGDIARIFDLSHRETKRVILPGENHTSIYIQEDAISYIVGGKGVMCYVHTSGETYLVHMLLKDVQKELPDYYYRCHSSYIVNLGRVLFLSSHEITLDDGSKIPISVKRYSEIKKDIDEWMTKQHKI